MEEVDQIVESPSSYVIRLPEGYSKILVDEAQVIIAVSLVISLKSLASFLLKKWQDAELFADKKRQWQLRREIEIKDIITQLLFLLKADRVIISHFVNGEITSSGFPLKKLKITFEKDAPGISSTSSYAPSDIPVTKILNELRELQRRDWVMVVTEELPDGNCRAYLASCGVRAQIQRLICRNDIPVALLTVQYIREGALPLMWELLGSSDVRDLFSRLLVLV